MSYVFLIIISHKQFGEHALTVDSKREVSSLRAEHGGALGIILLLHAMAIYFEETVPKELTVYIDNLEVVRRG